VRGAPSPRLCLRAPSRAWLCLSGLSAPCRWLPFFFEQAVDILFR
jgi:hypothetical protein